MESKKNYKNIYVTFNLQSVDKINQNLIYFALKLILYLDFAQM